MEILEVRQSMVERLRKKFPTTDIAAHPRASFGPADLTEALKNRNLALRLAFAGVPEDAEWSSDDTDIPTAWALYVCAKDVSDKDTRDVAILAMLPALIQCIAATAWAECCSEHKAETIRSGELFPGEVDGKSVAVWSVSWKQVLTISPCDNGDDLRPLLTLITRYDLATADGTIEASDTISMRTP